MLFICIESKTKWEKLKKWLVESLEVGFEFQECEILFGIPFKRDTFLEFLNYLIILGKWFINKVKTNNKSLYFMNFLHVIIE